MSTSMDERNQILDEIVTGRRTIRAFTDETPPRASIEAIIKAGLLGPFAKLTVGEATDFRRFMVFTKPSQALDSLIAIVRDKGRAQLEAMKDNAAASPQFLQRLEAVSQGRIPGLGTAPYLIMMAELKGPPHVEMQSIAHCLENMWLKATALGLGFQLVSALSMLADEPRFWELCQLPPERYAVNGCVIGVPAGSPQPPANLPSFDEAVIWME